MYVGFVICGIFAIIGFVIATFKMPEIGPLRFTKDTAGEKIDEIIFKAFKFKGKGYRLYFYTKEDEKDG